MHCASSRVKKVKDQGSGSQIYSIKKLPHIWATCLHTGDHGSPVVQAPTANYKFRPLDLIYCQRPRRLATARTAAYYVDTRRAPCFNRIGLLLNQSVNHSARVALMACRARPTSRVLTLNRSG